MSSCPCTMVSSCKSGSSISSSPVPISIRNLVIFGVVATLRVIVQLVEAQPEFPPILPHILEQDQKLPSMLLVVPSALLVE
nr:hypothetical protein Itr_chr09CG06380 [Ipomoea trifida]